MCLSKGSTSLKKYISDDESVDLVIELNRLVGNRTVLTSHSACGCKWQRWCYLDFLPAHHTLSSKDAALSPVG